MAYNLRNRSFLTLKDFTPKEIDFLLTLAAELKAANYAGTEQPRLKGKHIALIFEKDSTRTRIGFEVAAADQGMHATYLGPSGTHMGHKETVKDTARVLGRVYDAVEYRGFSQHTVETLAEHAGVPVFNGLTDEFHPTQILADFLTLREATGKPLRDTSFCFLGDTSSNMADSLLIGAAKMGMDVRLCSPTELHPADEVVRYARGIAAETGARITLTADIGEGVKGVDAVYTDVWVSMGEAESVWKTRIEKLAPYRVTPEVMRKTGNDRTVFMHCLPAFHSPDTEVAGQVREKYGVNEMEVSDAVFESGASVVFDQAENRMHTIKAVLVATIGD
ncbi:ornithine carbamoyltransferase [Limimonas halophila]|uniref:Ornithine carbamoyltransferase n=1 Tax=Limimonas halophila TaxID=1082479 RepID=A0A1G7Q031_9PROT|nr:ornithine carbamoyltransferase [Limimonas halophila]SDF91865.1 ornithine carbamoyltransferase [Limimonas halophila]